jgi:hypothetical protein
MSGFATLAGFLCAGPFVLLVFAFWIWMLVDAITNRGLGDGEKVAWVVVVVFLHFLGALIYFLVGRNKRPAGT